MDDRRYCYRMYLRRYKRIFSGENENSAHDSHFGNNVCFLAVAVILGILLAKTKFGRMVYIMGNAETTAKYSSVPVDLVKVSVFTLKEQCRMR